MVKKTHCVCIAVVSSLLSHMAFGDSPIQSVQVVSEPTVRIKPCEPMWILLDITVDSSVYPSAIKQVPSELTHHVAISNRDTGAQLYNSERDLLAMFFLNGSSSQTVNGGTRSFQALAMLYWNIQNDNYLFEEPGAFRVEIGPKAGVDVLVEEPTKEEQEVIVQMRDIGLEFAMFVMNAGDHRARAFAPRAEKMLEKYPNTVYAKHLSISLGMAKLPLLRHEAYRRADFDAKSFTQEQLIAAKKYFEPYCKGEMKSPYEAAAGYYLAQQILNQLRYEPEDANEESAAPRREAKVLLEKVKNSPYSLDYQSKAASLLQSLDD